MEADQLSDTTIHPRMTAALRLLTAVSGMVILVGGILLLVRQGNAVTNFQTFLGKPTSLRLVPQIVTRAFQGQALALVQFGILLLIVTPVIRVLFCGDRICGRTGLAICGRGRDRAGSIGFEPDRRQAVDRFAGYGRSAPMKIVSRCREPGDTFINWGRFLKSKRKSRLRSVALCRLSTIAGLEQM